MIYKLFLFAINFAITFSLLFYYSSTIDAQQNIAPVQGTIPKNNNLYSPATSHVQYSSSTYKLFETDELGEDEAYFLMVFSLMTFFSGLILISSKNKARVKTTQ